MGPGGSGRLFADPAGRCSSLVDTQWPRYYVFKQNTPEDAHLNCGTIHAPDPELALMNARDVFVRRPDCYNLWVVPADRVVSLTLEQLKLDGPDPLSEPGPGPAGAYAVFTKSDYRDRHAYAGELQAAHAHDAMRKALDRYPPDSTVAWRVAPVASILSSVSEDGQSWFEPAHDKPYRHPAFYQTDSMMRAVRAGKKPAAGRDDE